MNKLSVFIWCGCNSYFCFLQTAGQETAKQALQEIVILPALRPEVGLLIHITFTGKMWVILTFTESMMDVPVELPVRDFMW